MTTLHAIRLRVLAILVLTLITGVATPMPAAAQAVDDAEDAVARLCTTSLLGRPSFTDEACAAAVREATTEAAGWPDYDPIAISEQGLRIQIAQREAAEEAAGWPDFDPTAIRPGTPEDVLAAGGTVSEMLRGDLSPVSFDA